jgi:hypothetical protein
MRKLSALVIAIFFGLVLSVLAREPENQTVKTAPNAATAESLLQRVYAMLPSFSPEDRALTLAQMVNSTGRNHPEKAQLWTDEIFRINPQIKNKRARIISQGLIIDFIATVNSDEALKKLVAIESSALGADYDTRAGAAIGVFSSFLKNHPTEWQRVAAVANEIGKTGRYPATAMSVAIGQLSAGPSPKSQQNVEAVAALVQEALQHLKAEPPSISANQDFVWFLRSRAENIPPQLLRPTLEELVARLSTTSPSAPYKLVTLAASAPEDPPIIVNNRNDALLAEILPLIHSLDPAWETDLRQKYPVASAIDEAMQKRTGVANLSGYSSAVNSPERTIQDLWSRRVDMLVRQHKPEEAFKDLEQISDPSFHAASEAEVASALKDSDPQRANDLLNKANQTLANTRALDDRFRILSALARTYISTHEQQQLSSVLDQTFKAGEDLVGNSMTKCPQFILTDRPGVSGLSLLVQTSAKLQPELILQEINSIRIPALQAHLLVAMARALEN